jgi:hypothetical protein
MPTERPLTIDEEQELEALLLTALELVPLPPELGLGEELPPEALVFAVDTAIDAARNGAQLSELLPLEEIAAALGALWADELARRTGWGLVIATFGADEPEPYETLAVVKPDRSVAVLPLAIIGAALTDRHVENNVGLLFHLVVRGDYPPSEPGAWRVLG